MSPNRITSQLPTYVVGRTHVRSMHVEIGRILWLSVLLSFGGVWRIRVALLFLYPVLLARADAVCRSSLM